MFYDFYKESDDIDSRLRQKKETEIIFEKVKLAKNDEEVQKLMMDYMQKKFKNKISSSKQIKLEQAAWLAYSTFREAGKGKIVSWILSNTLAYNVMVNKIFGDNTMSYINRECAEAIKTPFVYYMKTVLKNIGISLTGIGLLGNFAYSYYAALAEWFRLARNINRENDAKEVFECLKFSNVSKKQKIIIESAFIERL